MKKLKCKICECEFVPEIKEHHISCDEVIKVGLFNFVSGTKDKTCKVFYCPQCGCQYYGREKKGIHRKPCG